MPRRRPKLQPQPASAPVSEWSEDQLAEIAEAIEGLEAAVRARPTLTYKPHPGQLAFHQAPHVVRSMFPGNRFGKTTAVGCETAWWIDHAHPYQKTPAWPILAVWFCPLFSQFDMIRSQLESECFSGGWTYNASKHFYRWPGGDILFLRSYDGSWEDVQGINPDWVVFDEEPPIQLWREMMMRKPGKRSTRYGLSATATKGETWMESTIFAPWRDLHLKLGHSIEQARTLQLHPYFWVLDEGTIEDNPGVRAEDRAWVDSLTWSGDAEAKVRRRGGFARFNGNPVFLQKWIDAALQRAAALEAQLGPGRIVSFVPKEAA